HLTVISDGSGGVISTPPGLDCDSTTCSSDFTDGAVVTLNATPAPGFVFDGWTVGPCTGTTGCAITLRADTQVTAKFTTHPPAEIHISVAVTGPGQVQGGSIDRRPPPAAVCDAEGAPTRTPALTAFPAAAGNAVSVVVLVGTTLASQTAEGGSPQSMLPPCT